AWRYPCYAVTDVQLLEAVAPRPDVAVADNAITYSDKGHGNTLMAGRALGGDLDGDHVHASFWKKLVNLMRATQAAVERLASLRWRLEADVIGSMTEPATAWGGGDVEAR
ncbi:unnamed protein product, partial [Symbiodinium necroappetens]